MSESSPVVDVDALFKLPLGEFTAARNALSAQLKKAGHSEEAGAVKELAKPSISAWAVNQLYWQQRKLFDRLLDAGEQLRRAQLKGDAARAASTARRDAVAELTRLAATVLRDGSFGATRDMLRRITTTLEALSSIGAAQGAPVAGRLVDDVDPPGFDAVAGLLQGGGSRATGGQIPMPLTKPAAKPAQRPARADDGAKARDEHKRLLAAAKAAMRDAERAAGAARKQSERAADESVKAAAHVQDAEKERERIDKQLARATKELTAAQERVRQAAAAATSAAAATDGAERALELARVRLEQVASAKT